MQSKIFFPSRGIVTPGDLIAEGDFQLPWSPFYFKVGQRYYSTVIGLVEVNDNLFEIIPLESTYYYPRVGDIVIGLVEDIEIYGWIIDIKAPYSAYLPAFSLLNRPANPGEDLRRYLDRGDYIIAKIEAFDRTISPVLTVKGKGLGRISSGAIVDILPVKVPRIIGKNRSMLETLTTETSCSINVAQNGRIWVECPSAEKEELLISAIKLIERESHQKGLTERIKKFLREGITGEKDGNNPKT